HSGQCICEKIPNSMTPPWCPRGRADSFDRITIRSFELSTRILDVMVRSVRTPREEARKARTGVYRRHILEAAEQVFAARGFEAAKLQDISAAAGLSMGTIYSIFPGKNELFDALVAMRGQELLAVARAATDARRPPREALLALGDAYLTYLVEHPDFLR